MKNTQLYPFERNRYFYGKLLSVEDFNSEQKYMNDKRRLINRLVHGVGVVCGLNVVRVDDATISIETGMAFDATGREIIVDSPVTKKLAMISGYDAAMSDGSNAYVYLCLEYNEAEKGNVHNVASGGGKGSSDKIREGYSLYLTASEPDDTINRTSTLFEQSTTVFWDGNIRIRHIIPKYVNPDQPFKFRIEVETYSKQFAAFSYDIQLICMNNTADGSSVIKVNFDEVLFEKTGKYSLEFDLTANNVMGTEGTATPDSSTFSLSYDKMSADGTISGKSTVTITEDSIADAIVAGNYNYSMDTSLRSTVGQRLYLARIGLINAAGSAIIENIDNVPFGQYVAGNVLLDAVNRSRGGYSSGGAERAAEQKSEFTGHPEHGTEISSGICRINLSSGSLKNKVFYSDEIVHGLGLGSVTIILAAQTNGVTVYGNNEIFKEDGIFFETAAKLNPTKGSFVIGVMTKTTILADFVDVKWTAIRDVDETISEKNSMKIMIKPNSLVVKPRETRYLEAVCSNMTNKTVRWSVSPENGGEIDSNGLYTAPNIQGVYEVIARSAVYPEVKASIMVVVRE